MPSTPSPQARQIRREEGHQSVVAFSHHSNALSNFYSDKLSKIQKLQDTAKNKLVGLRCIQQGNNNNIMIEDETQLDNDLKGDVFTIKNSARKNKVNNLDFESSGHHHHFMTDRSSKAMTLQVDRTFATGPNNIHTLKLNLLKLQPVPTSSSPKDLICS